MKFLIIRFSSIGDIVLTTPVIRCLSRQVPGAEIHYLTKDTYKTILESNPYINRLHLLHNDINEVIDSLRAEKFDCIIDLHHNLRTLQIKRALKHVPAYSFNKLNVQKWLLTALKINVLPHVHIVDRYLQTVQRFGVTNDGQGLDYFIAPHHLVTDSDIPAAQCLGYVAVVIGAAYNTKKLPVNKLTELCRNITYPVMLLGGPEDRAAGEQIAAQDPIKIYNSCGKFSLSESADLVRRARLVITHDTGLMHIAAAFKRPVISVWGSTVPAFGMSPYYGNAMVPAQLAGVKKLWCRPCSKIGYVQCPLKHFRCMNDQDITGIAQKAVMALQSR